MSKTQENTKVVVEDKKLQTGSFVRENQKSLIFIVGAILAIILVDIIWYYSYHYTF